jgi:sec-independent protein translocase protein TatA
MTSSTLLVIGWHQIVLIVVIVLILFGGKKLPELMKGLGKGMKEFKDATKELNEDNKEEK